MSKLSVVMIAKNEAANLPACLASVVSLADEIVVGDTGSEDETKPVAQSFGARVIGVSWNNDFAEARNCVLAHATGDWLLHLDADEVVDSDNAQRIRSLVDNDCGGADAVEVCLANYCNEPRAWRWIAAAADDEYARGFAGFIRAPLLRLFRNHRGFEYREPVHESITESVRDRSGVVLATDILIHHYGYSATPEIARRKARLYLDIARRKVQERPHDPKAWHDLAEQALALGDDCEAEQACRTALQFDGGYFPAVMTLATMYLNRGDIEPARLLLEPVAARVEDAPLVSTALAAIELRQGRFVEAKERLTSVLSSAPTTIMALYYLSRTHDQLNDSASARKCLESICSLAPALEEFKRRFEAHRLRGKGEELFSRGALREALEVFLEALQLDFEDPVTHNNLGVLAHALGDSARAATYFQTALKIAPAYAQALANIQVDGGLPKT